jgi:RluA family pseudouridine synthase
MEWVVSPSEAGQKLVNFLKNKLGSQYSARHLKQSIEKNRCRVNQRIEHFASTVLARGDKITFEVEQIQQGSASAFKFSPADILYEDKELLIYNKPAGVSSDGEELTEAIKQYGPAWELLHRLDKDTTGLLMFTRGAAFREKMVDLFKTHLVDKVYLAIVDGLPKQSSGKIDNYLTKVHAYKGQSLWGAATSPHEGHHAITTWEVARKGVEASLVRCHPQTGRTHQIRVHMSAMGHPILGDTQYGSKAKCRYYAPRCLLHAYQLSFIHPLTGESVKYQAPIPADFMKASKDLIGGETS